MTTGTWPTAADAHRALAAPARPFDIAGPLPDGVALLEASAGTGKTYAIASLAAHYVAGGVGLERMLIVTFTRMATGELRERVRDRLVAVKNGLARALAGATAGAHIVCPPGGGDPVVELLAAGPCESVRLRHARIEQALAGFDAATIATTHGFCQEILNSLGLHTPMGGDFQFVHDVSDLIGEVVDDLYVRRFHTGDRPPFGRSEALAIVAAAVAYPDAAIATARGEVAEMRRRLALAARAELQARKQRMGVVTYDDLVTRLDAALTGDRGSALAARLRARYDVVLIDEFQDTDPIQWRIVRRAFGDGARPLVLIADPKQAIYAFRGADVYSYLEAAREATTQATLTVNWRCDQSLIDAYDALFGNAQLGEAGIPYRRVRAARSAGSKGLRGAPHSAPLRIRVVARDNVACTPRGFASNAAAREHIAKDLAGDLVALLASAAEIHPRSADADVHRRRAGPEIGGAEAAMARVRPADVAVLVRTNRGAALVRQALEQAGVPAVINGAGSVFATESAREWLTLLEALERPASIPRAHAAAMTAFLGWRAERVASTDDAAWEALHRQLHEWARLLRDHGVASLAQAVSRGQGMPQRLLAHSDGERRLTDLNHTAELLHAAAYSEQLGPTALTGWLRRRILEADTDTSDEERDRRLESDAQAVQVLTIHRSKGLEFPIVYLPFLWEPGYIPDRQPVACHDPEMGAARTLDVALQGADFVRHREQYVREQRGEELRLAYVALTRARHQAVVWWAGSWDSRHSPLGRLAFCRDDDGTVASAGSFTPDDDSARRRFEAIAAQAPGAISVEPSVLSLPSTWSPPPELPGMLVTARLHRRLDVCWRRTSYTDITAAHQRELFADDDGAADQRVGSEPEDTEPEVVDEGGAIGPVIVASEGFPTGEVEGVSTGEPQGFHSGPASASKTSPLAVMPAGAEIGTFVHRVLESVDFAAHDLDRELSRAVGAVRARRAVELADAAAVRAGLRAVIETPLGPSLPGFRLRDLARADRLDELRFELPLAGGDRPGGRLTPAQIGDLLRQHLSPHDPLAGYADRLADAALAQELRGYLTGSLDLVVRMPGRDRPRFAVFDYKTNWLAGRDEPLTVGHYRPSALVAEMQCRHYLLQALLYTVALHRYLRWRLVDYQPRHDLAGVVYLFLRGMAGPDTPEFGGQPCGVFSWRPPSVLVAALSDLLDGGAR